MSDSDAFDGCIRALLTIVFIVVCLVILKNKLDLQSNYIIDLQRRIAVLEQKVK